MDRNEHNAEDRQTGSKVHAVTSPDADILSETEQQRILSSFRLTIKLAIMIVAIVSVLATLVFVLVDRIFVTLTPSIRHDLEWKARHGAMELSSSADLGVAAGDRATIARAAREFLSDPDVVAVRITGRGGRVLFERGRAKFPRLNARADKGQVFESGGLLVAFAPMQIEGYEVGRVGLAISTARMQAGADLRSDVLIAGALGSLAALLLALGFVNLYIGPLIKVSEAGFEKLKKTTVAALEAARLKSEFLANMSHEIRTPMNGIIGVTKLALGGPLESGVRRYFELIDVSSRGLLNVINDVLDFSKIEAGKYEIRNREFAPRDLLQESLELIGERCQEKGLELIHRIAPDVPARLWADPDRIRQVLLNLLGNAAKFTSQGEVTVSVAMADGPSGERLLKFSVRDTGPGIDLESQARLFEAFMQVDGSYVRQHGGTGLGLAIAKRLTDLMGGQIDVESVVARGSEFWFTVVVEEVTSSLCLEVSPLAGRAVVVDANPGIRGMIGDHMRRWGMSCEELASLEQAKLMLERAAQRGEPFQVVVMPAPRFSGDLSTIELLRSTPGLEELPLVFVGAPGQDLDLTAVGQGRFALVEKPVRASNLYESLCKLLTEQGDYVSIPQANVEERTRILTDRPVLVVEDNEINRFVAVRQLRALGYQAETVVNGAEAVEAVFTREYAAVLMDCQMPVMDGYAAAREIRRREGSGRRIPIIAVTAHALTGERDHVLAAGMDDYIPKPVKPSALERALRYWRGRRTPEDEVKLSAPTEQVKLEAPQVGAELDADAELMPRLVQLFRQGAPAQVEELSASIAARDAEAARMKAHKLKGSLYAIGASKLASSIEDMRGELQGAAWSSVDTRLREVRARFARVLEEILHRAAENLPQPGDEHARQQGE